jgi:putative transcriptional regulator
MIAGDVLHDRGAVGVAERGVFGTEQRADARSHLSAVGEDRVVARASVVPRIRSR